MRPTLHRCPRIGFNYFRLRRLEKALLDLKEAKRVCKECTESHIMYVSMGIPRDDRYWTTIHKPMADAMIAVDKAEQHVKALGGSGRSI